MAQVTATAAATAGSSDAALVARAQQGDQAAFELLVAPRIDRLLRLADSIVSNDADASDAVQETCLRAWRQITRLRDADRFDAWLWQIAINTCRSALRTRRRVNVREVAMETMPVGFDLPAPGRGIGDDLSAIDVVQRAFRELDADKRPILVLHHVEERSIAEIAALLGIPEGTAKWRLFAARQALERALEVERP